MRLIVAGLAVVGLVSLFSGGAGVIAGAGLLVLAPLFFIAKIALFMLLFGTFARGFARHGHRHRSPSGRSADWETGWSEDWSDWRARWESRAPQRRRARRDRHPVESRPDTERFEEWHRMAHAKQEVDSWVDPQVPSPRASE